MPAFQTHPPEKRLLVPRYQPLVVVAAAAASGILADYYAPQGVSGWGSPGLWPWRFGGFCTAGGTIVCRAWRFWPAGGPGRSLAPLPVGPVSRR